MISDIPKLSTNASVAVCLDRQNDHLTFTLDDVTPDEENLTSTPENLTALDECMGDRTPVTGAVRFAPEQKFQEQKRRWAIHGSVRYWH